MFVALATRINNEVTINTKIAVNHTIEKLCKL